ncbi:UNVERIFIED_ORG: membrane-bound ClpP family serine protease [Arthrobacter sp. UYCu721]
MRFMNVVPSERHRKWIGIVALVLFLYFLLMSGLSFSDGDWLLGLLFLVLALVLVGAELAKLRSWKGTKQDRGSGSDKNA